MGTTPTTIPTITAPQFAQRLAAVFPRGWASVDAQTNPTAVLYNVLKMMGAELSFELGAVQYAADATRIQTAQNGALDLASLDYFGSAAPYALPRLLGETDPAYSARIQASLLPPGATRQAMVEVLTRVTGFAPRIIEFWNPADTGAFDMPPGTPMAFWDVDVPPNCFRWTDQGGNPAKGGFTAYQALIETVLPQAQPFGNNPTPSWDTLGFYWDVANAFGFWLIDPEGASAVGGEQLVLNAINRTKCEGTVCWVKFVQPPPSQYWDKPGLVWDEAGQVWQ